jgi:hypothetical protein
MPAVGRLPRSGLQLPAQQAEFIALRIGEHMPSLVPALTDIRRPGSGRQQPRKLGVLVAANRADVEVQPEQAGRGRGMGLEHDRGLQAAEPGTDRPDLDAVGVPGELGVAEDLAPEGRQPRRIAAVED